jgi:hypothetical protein
MCSELTPIANNQAVTSLSSNEGHQRLRNKPAVETTSGYAFSASVPLFMSCFVQLDKGTAKTSKRKAFELGKTMEPMAHILFMFNAVHCSLFNCPQVFESNMAAFDRDSRDKGQTGCSPDSSTFPGSSIQYSISHVNQALTTAQILCTESVIHGRFITGHPLHFRTKLSLSRPISFHPRPCPLYRSLLA